MSNNKDTKDAKELTPEQIQEYRKNLNAFYKAEIGQLTLAAEYENLRAEIETAKCKQLEARIRMAQLASAISEPAAPDTEQGTETTSDLATDKDSE